MRCGGGVALEAFQFQNVRESGRGRVVCHAAHDHGGPKGENGCRERLGFFFGAVVEDHEGGADGHTGRGEHGEHYLELTVGGFDAFDAEAVEDADAVLESVGGEDDGLAALGLGWMVGIVEP